MLDYTLVISDSDIIIRLLIWTVLSLIIWLEREYRHQPAWIRTHINIRVISRVNKDVNIFALHKRLKDMNKLFSVSINEIVK